MATVHYEIHSFVAKFTQLCAIGLNANLSLDNLNGNIFVNIHADTGLIHQNTTLPNKKDRDVHC